MNLIWLNYLHIPAQTINPFRLKTTISSDSNPAIDFHTIKPIVNDAFCRG